MKRETEGSENPSKRPKSAVFKDYVEATTMFPAAKAENPNVRLWEAEIDEESRYLFATEKTLLDSVGEAVRIHETDSTLTRNGPCIDPSYRSLQVICVSGKGAKETASKLPLPLQWNLWRVEYVDHVVYVLAIKEVILDLVSTDRSIKRLRVLEPPPASNFLIELNYHIEQVICVSGTCHFEPKETAVLLLQKLNDPNLCFWGADFGGGKKYVIATKEKLFDLIEYGHHFARERAINTLYDYHFADQPVCPFLDLDTAQLESMGVPLQQDNLWGTHQLLTKHLRSVLIELFKETFSVELRPESIHFRVASGPDPKGFKWSMHVIIKQRNIFFANITQQKQFWEAQKEKLAFDPAVYSREGCLRLPFNRKYDSNRVFRLFPDPRWDLEVFETHIITIVEGDTPLPMSESEAKIEPVARPRLARPAPPTDKEQAALLTELRSVTGLDVEGLERTETGWKASVPVQKCAVYPRVIHTRPGSWYFLNYNAIRGVLTALPYCCKTKSHVGETEPAEMQKFPVNKNKAIAELVQKLFPPEFDILGKPAWGYTGGSSPANFWDKSSSNVEYRCISTRHLSLEECPLGEAQVLVVNSPCSTNKTGYSRDLCYQLALKLRKQQEQVSILCIASRIAINGNTYSRFTKRKPSSEKYYNIVDPDLGRVPTFEEAFGCTMEKHSDYSTYGKSALSQVPALTCTLEALRHFFYPSVPTKDIIYLDETFASLCYVCQSTTSDMKDYRWLIASVLANLLRRARYVVCLDATLDRRLVEWLLHQAEKPALLIENTYKSDERTYKIIVGKKEKFFLRMVLERVKRHQRGEHIVIAVQSVTELDNIVIESRKLGKEVDFIKGPMPDQLKQDIVENVDKHVRNCDVFVFNNALGSAADITVVVDALFCHFAWHGDPWQLMQMGMRVRHLKEKEVVICFSSTWFENMEQPAILEERKALETYDESELGWNPQAALQLHRLVEEVKSEAEKRSIQPYLELLARYLPQPRQQIQITSGKYWSPQESRPQPNSDDPLLAKLKQYYESFPNRGAPIEVKEFVFEHQAKLGELLGVRIHRKDANRYFHMSLIGGWLNKR